MDSMVISITIYLITANLVAGTIYFFGQKRLGLLWFEYPFIYLPWLALQLITREFVALDFESNDLLFKYFLFMMQGFSCGLLGGSILLARFIFPAETPWQKLRVTALSAVAFSLLYLFSRWVLLEMFYFLFG